VAPHRNERINPPDVEVLESSPLLTEWVEATEIEIPESNLPPIQGADPTDTESPWFKKFTPLILSS